MCNNCRLNLNYSQTVDKKCKNIAMFKLCNFNGYSTLNLTTKIVWLVLNKIFVVSVKKFLQSM